MTEVYKIEIIKMLGKSVFGANFEQDNAKIILKRCKKLEKGFTKNLNVKLWYGSIDKLTIMIRSEYVLNKSWKYHSMQRCRKREPKNLNDQKAFGYVQIRRRKKLRVNLGDISRQQPSSQEL